MTTNDVFRKIKEISQRTANPRPPIMVSGIAKEMQQLSEQLIPILVELKDMRLITFNEPAQTSLKLTLLGFTVNR